MTKSGIGTTQSGQVGSNGEGTTGHSNPSASSSLSIAAAEIPIWVADKKKWVTGISKKTTINDLIYAILKQCQITHSPPSNNDSTNHQYVLVEYTFEPNPEPSNHEMIVSSQRVLNADLKVYKFINKWSQSPNQTQSNNNNNLMLKILQRQTIHEKAENAEANNLVNQNSHSSSLATKLLKKFGVTSSSQQSSSSTLNSKNPSNSTVNNNSINNPTVNFRYVDVKLPNPTQQQQQLFIATNHQSVKQSISPAASSGTSTSASTSTSTNNQRNNNNNNYDPNSQKTFLFTSILEKENKLKNQVQRIQLIDEILKETEKTAKYSNLTFEASNCLTNPTYSPSEPKAVVDLNDIYCHFPEMCTHHLKEVEDFTLMCCQLFQLEEAIKNQKQILTSLETDLQKELNLSQSYLNNNNNNSGSNLMQNIIDSPETSELRKEVNMSREQTRVQCKQLHDLDLRMRQNEQSLMLKEQQLQNLLEELYIQEIYADNAIESAITNTKNNHHLTNLTHENLKNVINLGEEFNPNNNNNNEEFNESEEGCMNDLSRDEQLNGVELVINNERLFNNEATLNNDALIRRQVRIFGDSNDDMLNTNLKQQQQINLNNNNHKNFNNQIGISSLNQQHKSFSYGNLSNNNNVANKMKTMSIKTSPSTDLINNNETKSIKINNNLQTSDQSSGSSGDNDSGISSMSSETTNTANTLAQLNQPPLFHQYNLQKPIILNQNSSSNNRQFLNNNQYLFQQQQQMNHLHQQYFQYQTQQTFNRQQAYLPHVQNHIHHLQPQQQQQQQTQNTASTQKSVLETLV